ncbi:MAG: hypothetical protein NW220_12645 [Leptolyngbyaceae cyanobacterium bins.349]|nr:hypothetical protein [Leptolyngbyaceae cyanobacterium bins.349]
MKRYSIALTVLLGAVLITSTGCFKQTTNHGLVERAEAKTASGEKAGKTQTVAGLSLATSLPFRENERMDAEMGKVPDDARSKIVSYESWNAESENSDWTVIVHRITYSPDIELDLSGAAKGAVEDVAEGLENACKPEYTINSQMIANMPGRYLSLMCNLPQEGPLYMEAVTFAKDATLWQVRVLFQDKAKLTEAKAILNSVKTNQISQR